METSGLAIQGMLKDEGNPGSSKTYVGDKPSEGAIEASSPRVSKSRSSKKDTVSDGGIARDWTKDAEGFGEKVRRKMQDSMLPERKMEERLGITDKNKSFCKRKGA